VGRRLTIIITIIADANASETDERETNQRQDHRSDVPHPSTHLKFLPESGFSR